MVAFRNSLRRDSGGGSPPVIIPVHAKLYPPHRDPIHEVEKGCGGLRGSPGFRPAPVPRCCRSGRIALPCLPGFPGIWQYPAEAPKTL